MINVFQPSLGEAELSAISAVFDRSWLGYGQQAAAFEAGFAEHLGVPAENVMFITCATDGLFLAVELLGLGAGDDVVMPSIGFVGAANAVAAAGARPVFCDVDPHTLNPGVADIERALTPRTKAVLPLHYGGYPGDIDEIADFCRSRGITLVEDAACAVSSGIAGTACGTFGDLGVWSFDSMKILVTGDGGMLYVRDTEMARRARGLAYHGLNRSSGYSAAKVSHRWWELDVQDFGHRMLGNDMTASIGSVQLDRLPEFMRRRRAVVERYDRLLAGFDGVRLPPALPAGHTTSYYFYWVQLDPEIRDDVAADLLDHDIYTTFRYPPLHKVPAYQADPDLPATDRAADSTLLLPVHQSLDQADVETVVAELRKSIETRCTK